MKVSRSVWRLGLGVALASGVGAGIAMNSTGCVIPDYCIVVITQGQDWCRSIVGAQMWPVGSPELAVPVLDGIKPPVACACFNDAEDEILWAEAPADKFEEYSAALESVVRDECDALAPPGWDHNCYDEGMDGPTFKYPYPGEAGSCVGDCFYANPPRDGCGDDPNPYECEELYGDGETGTGGGETGGDDTDGQEGTSWRR